VTSSPSPTPASPVVPFLRIAIVALLAAHILAVLSPLRLNDDAVLLLQMTASATDGRGINPPELSSHLPIGYPLLLSAIERAGLLGQATIVIVNILALFLGLASAASLLERDLHLSRRAAYTCALLTACSWVMVKHTPLAVTDVLFFGLALSCVWLLSTACRLVTTSATRTTAYWLTLLAALTLAAAATLVRTAGLALALPILFTFLGGSPGLNRLLTHARRTPALSIALIAITLLSLTAAAFILRDSPYIHAFLKSPAATEGKAFGPSWRLLEAGQLTLNLPVAVIESTAASAGPTAASLVPWAVRAIGAVALVLACLGAWSLRRSLSITLVFIASYLALVALWPYQDPRFLLPILPLAWGLIGLTLPRAPHRAALTAIIASVVVLLHLALSAIGFQRSIALTFAGQTFADSYGSQRLANSYRAAWDLPLNSALPTMPIPAFVDTLRRYDRRGQKAAAVHHAVQPAAEELNALQQQQKQAAPPR